MLPASRLILQYLILVEPVVTMVALLAWIYASKRKSGMPAMRDYLVVRSVNTTINVALLAFWVRVDAGPGSWQQTLYLYEYWIGFFVQAWFMLRVAEAVLQQFLGPLPGLRTLARTVFRWVLVAAMLLALPAGIAFAIVFVSRSGGLAELFRFLATISIAELIPIASVMVAGLYVGCRTGGRAFAILSAFSLEPLTALATSWFQVRGVLVWTNLVLEVVCYIALGLWTWYAFHPDREEQRRTPNATQQHWDQLARKALRHRLPPVEEPEPVAQGGRPWPRTKD